MNTAESTGQGRLGAKARRRTRTELERKRALSIFWPNRSRRVRPPQPVTMAKPKAAPTSEKGLRGPDLPSGYVPNPQDISERYASKKATWESANPGQTYKPSYMNPKLEAYLASLYPPESAGPQPTPAGSWGERLTGMEGRRQPLPAGSWGESIAPEDTDEAIYEILNRIRSRGRMPIPF